MENTTEKSCENCSQTEFCNSKEDGVCVNHRFQKQKDENDPLADMDMPTISAANWLTDDCGKPC